ncbi:MAG: hypothetical protein KDK25_05305 [Leptospiraceae bacterium]|nr:hypothetical protein [Leptospiraceae bacterium]
MAEKKDKGGRKKVIKFRIPGDSMIYTGFLLLDMDRSSVLEWSGNAGSGAEYMSVPLELPWKEFGSWLRTREFQGQVNTGATADIQRFIQSRKDNLMKADRMIELLNSGDITTLEYEWALDLEVALGIHNPEIEFQIADLGEEEKRAETREIEKSGLALQFIISPFQGIPLFRLQIDQRVHVRFKDVEKPAVQNYLKSQGIEIKDGRAEAVARIVSMKSLPDRKEMLIHMQLPGKAEGFVVEENSNIKVRTYTPPAKSKDSSTMGGFHAGVAGEISLGQFAVFGGLILGLILLVSVIWALI